MKEKILTTKEEEFLESIKDFFQTRSVNEHLIFIDYWVKLILAGKTNKKWTNPSTLYFLYGKLIHLFKSCHKILQNQEYLQSLDTYCILDHLELANEKQTLFFFPYHLKVKEQLHPFEALRRIFNKQDIHACKQQLKEWLADGLHGSSSRYPTDYLIPLYSHIKKLIEACWLIHERVISKNSFKTPVYTDPLLNYALTEPFLFIKEEAENPFLMVESFFNFTNLSGYRKQLQKWYLMAITEELVSENPNDQFFIYNQYLSLVQAGYLISASNLIYIPTITKSNKKTLGQWLLGVRDHNIKNGDLALSDEAPHVLTMAERAAPFTFIKDTLNLANVTQLRYGLKEWLYASYSEQSSIYGLNTEYAYEQYLTLQKLTEAFYLIIIENATIQSSLAKNITHED